MQLNRTPAVLGGLLALVCTSCYGPRGAPVVMMTGTKTGPHSVYAFYDSDNLLITNPLRRVEELLAAEPRGFSDVYVVSHGWNYTLDEAIANYQRYLQAADRVHAEIGTPNAEYRPLYVLVGWTSSTRPLGQTARSILPFGLDDAVGLVTTSVDRFVFHLPSVWKQSMNATTNALGWRRPDEYFGDDWPAREAEVRSYMGQPGLDLPASELLYRLMDMNHEEKLRHTEDGRSARARIHAVGHSYGAKLMAIASIEAVRRCSCERPDGTDLESLLLFNAAFHPSELGYRTGSGRADVATVLDRIPRKALVYSDTDFANGATFELSQIFLNNQHAQAIQQSTKDWVDDLQQTTGGKIAVAPLTLVAGAVQLVYSSATGVVQWLVRRGTNMPQDFWYHLNHAELSRDWWPGVRHAFNAVHYFAPLDQLWGGPADQKGLFRPSTSALGRSGLYRFAVGRPFEWGIPSFSNTGPLTRYAASGDVPPWVYEEMAARLRPPGVGPYDDDQEFYSFDASHVLYGGLPFVGSHTALGEEDEVLLQTQSGTVCTPRIDSTVRFVLNFTGSQP